MLYLGQFLLRLREIDGLPVPPGRTCTFLSLTHSPDGLSLSLESGEVKQLASRHVNISCILANWLIIL